MLLSPLPPRWRRLLLLPLPLLRHQPLPRPRPQRQLLLLPQRLQRHRRPPRPPRRRHPQLRLLRHR